MEMINGITHINVGKPIDQYSDDQLRSIKNIFICPSFKCNLGCHHCTLSLIKTQKTDIDKICSTLDRILTVNSTTRLDLFGGEPLILPNSVLQRLKPYLLSQQSTINSNLLYLDDFRLDLIRQVDAIDTSWNPDRFTKGQYIVWLNNLTTLREIGKKYNIMVALTNDVIAIKPKDFVRLIRAWKPKNVEFKQVIGDDSIDFERVDKWLCKLYRLWDFSIGNLMFNEVRRVAEKVSKWRDYCSATYTIMPNGNLKFGCSYYEYTVDRSHCMYCQYYDICEGGCLIQKRCIFPKGLYQRICKKIEKGE